MRQPSTVALVRTRPDADLAAMDGDLATLLALLDEPLDALRDGMTVLIKPNLFQASEGFHASPVLLTALAKAVAERGARPVVAERTQAIYEILRDHPIHRYARVVSLDDLPLRIVAIPEARSLRVPVTVPELVLDCDYFIGVPQPRTHASVVYSNAMKNLVGLLPDYTSRIVHLTGVDESTVDLNVLRPHDLVVCDGTTIVEGNYPIDGRSRAVGFLAAGRNPLSLDVVVAELAGVGPHEVLHLVDGHERGLGPIDLSDIEVRGEPMERLRFDIVRAPKRPVAPPNVRLYADEACVPCQRYLAGALAALDGELREWGGELTVVAGTQRADRPPANGPVVLVGNCMYAARDQGIYVEGSPPRAIQAAAFRYAMGAPVTQAQRGQFRVPPGWAG